MRVSLYHFINTHVVFSPNIPQGFPLFNIGRLNMADDILSSGKAVSQGTRSIAHYKSKQ